MNCIVPSDVEVQEPQYAVTKTAKPPPRKRKVARPFVLQTSRVGMVSFEGWPYA